MAETAGAAAGAAGEAEDQCSCACSCGKRPSAPQTLFVDEAFPARWNVLLDAGEAAAWLRPHELRAEPRLFVEGSSRFAVQQGSLGDCWFIAACAAVADRQELVKKVVPEGQALFGPGYDGSVTFRLWALGEWQDVRIDDRIPVNAHGTPIYAHCKHPDEFWLPLLEKAFAKFHTSYCFIDGAFGADLSHGLVNLTEFCIDNLGIERWNIADDFMTIKNASEKGAMILCRTSRSGPGLPGHHAYTITKTFHRPAEKGSAEELQLLRVRNPWGSNVEWTGAWKDGDEKWNKLSKEIKESMEYKEEDDGEFWIDMKDFSENFTEVCIATDKPPGAEKMKVVGQITGHWSDDDKSGGHPEDLDNFAKNPQFLLVALGAQEKEDGDDEDFDPDNGMETMIELVQEHNRQKRIWSFKIGFYVFETCAEERLTAEQLKRITYVAGAAALRDETSVRSQVRLRAGRRYVVVPTTQWPGQKCDFLLRVFSRHARVRLAQLPSK